MGAGWRIAWAGATAGCVAVVASSAACGNLLGLDRIHEEPCIGSGCEAGADGTSGDAPDDTSGDDGGSEACNPVPVLDPNTLQAPACPPAQDSGCAPGPIDAAALHWVPPKLRQGACSVTSIDDYIDACAEAQSTVATCMAYDQANGACYSCLVSHFTDPSYGAIIFQHVAAGNYSHTVQNTGGCIAALDPCNKPCAIVTEEYAECAFAACLQTCTTLPDYDNCVTKSEFCGQCGTYQQAAHDCAMKLIMAGSPAAPCVMDHGNFTANLDVVGLAICDAP